MNHVVHDTITLETTAINAFTIVICVKKYDRFVAVHFMDFCLQIDSTGEAFGCRCRS